MSAWGELLGIAAYLASASACLALAVFTISARAKSIPVKTAVSLALFITALWALSVPAISADSPFAILAFSASQISWYWVLYCLFAKDGRHRSLTPIRPVVIVITLVELVQPCLLLVIPYYDLSAENQKAVVLASISLRLLTAAGALVLVHNLYVGAAKVARPVLRWPAAAMSTLWLFDMNYATVAYISGELPTALGLLRSLVPLVMVLFIGIGATGERSTAPFRPSRSVAFQSVSLLIIGGYLLGMVAVGQALSVIAGDFGRLMQVVFVVAASALALISLPSPKMRATLRDGVTKHLFQHRFDYREEWLRFNETLARGSEAASPLPERVVQAMADITDSPAGLLMVPDGDDELHLAARWHWPSMEVKTPLAEKSVFQLLDREINLIEIDPLRERGATSERPLPGWILDDPNAWAIVPLEHFERLVGVILLARPVFERKLDWEDFDLLRLAGQQLASYLAEQAGQEALMESSRFDEFNRRIAFVMHDIKNLASQLSLLARNAEKHAENPDFRADMLLTLRSSADKLNTLLARLGRYGAVGTDAMQTVDLGKMTKIIARRMRIELAQSADISVAANRDALEQAIVHLVQNALDASEDGEPVFVSCSSDGMFGIVEVSDSGPGMSAEFLRSGLFKPFVSSKPGGFGIGAFEARELVRAMGGRLDVDSREGLGTRFVIRIPLAGAVALSNYEKPARKTIKPEVA
ncbi:XrtA/PEP-CTERM system histidine kinase PrsK [Altererythrobacter aquiaggeris]|uniref:XrtA/PEP-CTERM system histidine kinase PrsK n=1 Tax=Aestuarierythrobacter aquiaggeris TaxID=1898396 RepID=UPI0030193EDD